MEQNNNSQSVKERVLSAIKSGKAKMRPRWHFVLRGILLATGAMIAGLLLLYLASFIVFSMRQTGAWFAPAFGLPGWFSFLRHVPWILIALSVIFIAVLEVLVRRYSFAYRRPLLYSVLVIVLIAIVAGIFGAPLHRGLFSSARFGERRPQIFFFGDFYRNFGLRHFGDVHRGTITGAAPGGFVMQDFGGETSTIIISSATRIFPVSGFASGNTVIVFGEESGNHTIQAAGVRAIAP